jgi:uncharacterized caspase-like protein
MFIRRILQGKPLLFLPFLTLALLLMAAPQGRAAIVLPPVESKADMPPIQPGSDEKRLALIIAEDNYRLASALQSPGNDAEVVSASLKKIAFDVTVVRNKTKSEMVEAIHQFVETVRKQKTPTVLVYYAGHGLQYEKQNYILPIDVDGSTIETLKETAIPASDVLQAVDAANKGGVNFFVMDTCRTNPYIESLRITGATRDIGKLLPNFDELAPPPNSAILLSTQEGSIAYDSFFDYITGGGASPFAKAYSGTLVEPDIEWNEFSRRVTAKVLEYTKGQQKPWALSTLEAEFFHARTDFAQTDDRTRAARVLVKLKNGKLKPTYDGSYALLIGVSKYDETTTWKSLPGVANDIAAVKKVLEEDHGFQTETVMDPDSATMIEALRKFISVHGAKTDARLLIYIAGHGYTTSNNGNKIGWFIPRDTPSFHTAPQLFLLTAISMRRIQEYSEIINAKHVLWVFDSCFSGQAIGMMPSGFKSGTTPFEEAQLSKPVRRIITSGSENQEVPDDSVFAQFFVDALHGKYRVGNNAEFFTGETLGSFLKENVYDAEKKKAGREQLPQNDAVVFPKSDAGDIVFRPVPVPVTQ